MAVHFAGSVYPFSPSLISFILGSSLLLFPVLFRFRLGKEKFLKWPFLTCVTQAMSWPLDGDKFDHFYLGLHLNWPTKDKRFQVPLPSSSPVCITFFPNSIVLCRNIQRTSLLYCCNILNYCCRVLPMLSQ